MTAQGQDSIILARKVLEGKQKEASGAQLSGMLSLLLPVCSVSRERSGFVDRANNILYIFFPLLTMFCLCGFVPSQHRCSTPANEAWLIDEARRGIIGGAGFMPANMHSTRKVFRHLERNQLWVLLCVCRSLLLCSAGMTIISFLCS